MNKLPANNPARALRQTVLVVNLGGMGDILLSAPAVRVLLEAARPSGVEFLVSTQGQGMAQWLFPGARIHSLRIPGMLSGCAGNARTLAALRQKKFELAVNMRSLVSARSALQLRALLTVVRPKKTAGRDTDGRGRFFDISIPEELPGTESEAAYDIALVKALGVAVNDEAAVLPLTGRDSVALAAVLARKGIPDDALLVGVHAGGAASHRWPMRRFAWVMRTLFRETGCRFALTGSLSERNDAEALARLAGVPAAVFAGESDIPGLAALIQRCALFISNDTGPMHVAAALRVPLIAVFGPGYRERYDPRHVWPGAQVFFGKASCSPCDKKRCASGACLDTVNAREVAAAAVSLLGSVSAGRPAEKRS